MRRPSTASRHGSVARAPARAEELESRRLLAAAAAAAAITADAPAALTAPRMMENLGRGVVAVRTSTTQVLVSWRLLGLDPSGIGFNVYRSANGAAPVKLNAQPLTAGTNYTDAPPSMAANNTYHVRPVINGVEGAPSGPFTLTANHATEPLVRVPLTNPLAGYTTKFVWVGDLDGDTEFDFVIDRHSPSTNEVASGNQFLEAYTRTGTRLWSIDLGHTTRDVDNIEPGAATLSVGNWDGVTVRDMDSDGKAEVLLKTANGVVFADGQVLTAANDDLQFISIVNGQTGAERARVQFANDYIADGPMAMMFGVGSADGVNPTLYIKAKNRVGSGGFNMTVQTYRFNGTTVSRLWKWNRDNAPAPDGHQIRIVDLDGDGKDEFCEIGFTLNSNGTFRYSLQTTGGIFHGDRFHIADIDPARPGLEGYGIQQNDGQLGQPDRILEYYYDAANGTILWAHRGTGTDVGRGMAADIDPRFPGMEVWSFQGLYNAATASNDLNVGLTEPNRGLRPWPQLGLWWDGDLLHELLNDGKFEYWDWNNPTTTSSAPRYFRASNYGGVGSGVNPLVYGDIMGDWREEAVYTNSAQNELLIFTTNHASPHRIYTLPHNPAYRNGMTIKGYMQSHHLDYFLGDGMAPAPVPNIAYAGVTQPPPPGPVYPAEEAVPGGGTTIDADRAGFNGTGFANFPADAGLLDFNNVYGHEGGNFILRFRFANGAGSARAGSLIINGVSQPVSFPPTGGWTLWQTLEVTAPLNAGAGNIVRLQSTGQDLGNVDELVVEPAPPPALGSVTGRVFLDADDDNAFDAGESAVAGLTVFLDADNDSVLDPGERSTVTSGAGAYAFADVAPGNYTVRVVAAGGYVPTVAPIAPVAGGSAIALDAAVQRTFYFGAAAAEHYRLRRIASGQYQVFINDALAYTLHAGIGSLAFSLAGGDDRFTLDLAGGGGAPLPAGGVTFDGGADHDVLAVVGSTGADALTFAAASLTVAGAAAPLNFVAAEKITLDGNGGSESLAINAGAVTLAAALRASALTIASGAQLDVRNHLLLHDYSGANSPIGTWSGSSYSGLNGMVHAGRNDGAWDGSGIVTSMPDAQLGRDLATLGLAEAADVLGIGPTETALWQGHTVDGSTVIVAYAWTGDANLDGSVDGGDYAYIDVYVGSTGADVSYLHGDFNYDGSIDGGDYAYIDVNVGVIGAPL